MRKLNSRETIILVITFGLIVIFIVYQFLVKPMQEGSGDIDDQLRVDQLRLLKEHQMMAQSALIAARYQNLTNIIGVADSEEVQMPTIISKIETAARENNIHIANIQPQDSINKNEAKFLAVELQLDGQWLDITHFLYTLQQQPNYYFINELNLEKYSDSSSALRGRIVVSRMCLVNS